MRARFAAGPSLSGVCLLSLVGRFDFADVNGFVGGVLPECTFLMGGGIMLCEDAAMGIGIDIDMCMGMGIGMTG